MLLVCVVPSLSQANDFEKERMDRWQQRAWYTKLAAAPLRVAYKHPYITGFLVYAKRVFSALKSKEIEIKDDASFVALCVGLAIGSGLFIPLQGIILKASTGAIMDAFDIPAIKD